MEGSNERISVLNADDVTASSVHKVLLVYFRFAASVSINVMHLEFHCIDLVWGMAA